MSSATQGSFEFTPAAGFSLVTDFDLDEHIQNKWGGASTEQLARIGTRLPVGADEQAELAREKFDFDMEVSAELADCLRELASLAGEGEAANSPEKDALMQRASTLQEARSQAQSASNKHELRIAKASFYQEQSARHTDGLIGDARSSATSNHANEKNDFYSDQYERKTQQMDKEWSDYHRRADHHYSDVRTFADKHGVKGMDAFDAKRRELEEKREKTKDRVEKSLVTVDIAQNDLNAADHVAEDLKRRKAQGENISDTTISEAEAKRAKAKELFDEAVEKSRKEIKLREEELERKGAELEQQSKAAKTDTEREAIARQQRELAHISTSLQTQSEQLKERSNSVIRTGADASEQEITAKRFAQQMSSPAPEASHTLPEEEMPIASDAPKSNPKFSPLIHKAAESAKPKTEVKGGEAAPAGTEKSPNVQAATAGQDKDKAATRMA